jgi:hypothetical protein
MASTMTPRPLFIWVNSAAGLAEQTAQLALLPRAVGVWAIAAALGGALGSELGRKKLHTTTLRHALAFVPIIAGVNCFSLNLNCISTAINKLRIGRPIASILFIPLQTCVTL